MTLNDIKRLSQEHPILFYDGVCNFCSGFVQFLMRHDRDMKFRFCSLQHEFARELREMNESFSSLDTVIAVKDQKIYTKSDVTFLILNEIGGLWKILTILQIIPKSFRDWLYTRFARNRYRLFGKSDQCHVPAPADLKRFL